MTHPDNFRPEIMVDIVEIGKSSSSIYKIGYDSASKEMFVQFLNSKDDSIYKYLNVDESTYKDFCASESLGQFLNKEIKYTHKFEKI